MGNSVMNIYECFHPSFRDQRPRGAWVFHQFNPILYFSSTPFEIENRKHKFNPFSKTEYSQLQKMITHSWTKYDVWGKLDQVNSANLLFKLWSMDIVTMDIMIYDSTGSLQGSTGWYLMLLGQYGAILVVTCWYWVSITWYWLVLSCTGLIKGFYACIYRKN